MKFETLDKIKAWERQKAMYLIQIAEDLGIDIDGYGEVGVNPNSGYTYLWLEDYEFVLYMEINCDLKRKDVYVMWTNMQNGDEVEERLSKFDDLDDIYKWCKALRQQVDNE